MARDYAKTYQRFIDEELATASGTQWMAAGEGLVRFCGGKKVEVNSLSTTGLGDYDSSKSDGTAYPSGAVTSTWVSNTLAMDRGVKFALDRVGPSDIDFDVGAEAVVREFARTQLAKEQDSYRINKLYTLAVNNSTYSATHVLGYVPDTDDVVDKLSGLVQTLENDCERSGGFVALIAADLKTQFLKASSQSFHSIQFEQQVEINGVSYDHVMMLNDVPCIFVPSSRMYTVMTSRSGRGTQTEGGMAPSSSAKRVYALVVACDTPLAVQRIDSLKQFGPEENQLFDGTAIQARYLYDLYVPKTKIVSIGALVEKAS